VEVYQELASPPKSRLRRQRHAKQLVQAWCGISTTVLSAKRVDERKLLPPTSYSPRLLCGALESLIEALPLAVSENQL